MAILREVDEKIVHALLVEVDGWERYFDEKVKVLPWDRSRPG